MIPAGAAGGSSWGARARLAARHDHGVVVRAARDAARAGGGQFLVDAGAGLLDRLGAGQVVAVYEERRYALVLDENTCSSHAYRIDWLMRKLDREAAEQRIKS